MNKATKKIILNYVLAPILLAILLWLIYRQLTSKGNFEQELHQVIKHFSDAPFIIMLPILLLAPANWCTEAFKWKMLLRKIEPVPYMRALSSVLTGMAFGLVTPSKIGDFAGRILYLENKNKLRAVIATLVGNMAQTLVTFIAGTLGLLYLCLSYPGHWQVLCLIIASLAGGLLTWMYIRIDKIAVWAEGKNNLRKIIISIRILKRYSQKDLLQILLVSMLRFLIYNAQFLLLANMLGAGIPLGAGMPATAVMFWLITVIPSIFVADLGVRGFVAGLIFTDMGIATNAVAILGGSYTIWLLNWVIPAVLGSLLLLTVRIVR